MSRRKQDSGIGHKQTERLFRAARNWKDQGSRSKWKAKTTLELYDTIVDIEKSLTPKSQIFEVDGASSTRDFKPKLSRKQIHRVMEKGLADDKRVWIHYVDRHGALTERLIKPIVVTDHGVNAYCYAREGGRYFIYMSFIDARLVDKGKEEELKPPQPPLPLWTSTDPPEIGYDIYIPSQWYMDHGKDDWCGGLGAVIKVEWREQYNTHAITIAERPNHGYFWENNLRGQQKVLAKTYRGRASIRRAHACPDRG